MSILRNTDKAGRLTHESCATYLHVCMFSPMSFSHSFISSLFQFFNFSIFQFLISSLFHFFNFSIFQFFIFSLLLISCQDHGTATVDESIPRDSMPLLRSYGVSTLISDSGILRYKIIAEDWFVYDRTNPPRWTFPKGLFLQKFDAQFLRRPISATTGTSPHSVPQALYRLFRTTMELTPSVLQPVAVVSITPLPAMIQRLASSATVVPRLSSLRSSTSLWI